MYANVGGGWTLSQVLSSGASGNQYYGSSVAVSGSQAIVGAVGGNNEIPYVYFYTLSGGQWIFQQKIGSTSNTGYGYSMALASNFAIITANSGKSLLKYSQLDLVQPSCCLDMLSLHAFTSFEHDRFKFGLDQGYLAAVNAHTIC